MAAKTLMTTTSNAQWTRLNASLMSLFQQKSKMALSQNKDVMKDIELLNHAVADLASDADMRTKLPSLIRGQMLLKGMIILRELGLRDLQGSALLQRLAEIWKLFFSHILITLEAAFQPILTDPEIKLRHWALVAFRDHVILGDSNIRETFEDALSQERIRPPAISHMLLMLQSVRTGCDKEQIVNAMTSFIMPYLGFYTEDPSRFGSYESKLDVMQDRMAPIQSVEDLDML